MARTQTCTCRPGPTNFGLITLPLATKYALLGWGKKLKELKVLVKSVRTGHASNFQDVWKCQRGLLLVQSCYTPVYWAIIPMVSCKPHFGVYRGLVYVWLRYYPLTIHIFDYSDLTSVIWMWSRKIYDFDFVKEWKKKGYSLIGNPFSLQNNLSSVLRMSSWRTLYSIHDKACISPVFSDLTTAHRISRPSMNLYKNGTNMLLIAHNKANLGIHAAVFYLCPLFLPVTG